MVASAPEDGPDGKVRAPASAAAGGRWQIAGLTGLCRVSVACGGRRVDLTLPSDIPVGTFLGELAWMCGVQLDSEQPAPLYLSRPVSGPVSASQTLAQAGVVDGDLLVLAERPVETPRVVDDLGRAISEAVQERPGRWDRAATVAALSCAAGLIATGGAVALAVGWGRAGRPGPLLPVLATGVLFGLAVIADWVTGAAAGSIRAWLLPAALPWGALALAAGTGAIDGGLAHAPTVAAAAGGAALVALAGAVADRARASPFLAVGLVAVALVGAAGMVAAGLTAEQAGSLLVVGVLGGLLLLPRVVVRVSGLPGLRDGSLAAEVTARVGSARRMLAWLAGGLSAALLVGAGLLVAAPGPAGPAGPAGRVLAVLAAVVLGLRARTYRFAAEVAAPVTAAALVVAIVAGAVILGTLGILAAATVALAVALALTGGAIVTGQGAQLSPVVGKAVELFELVCLLAVIPLAMLSSAAFAELRAFAAGHVGGS
jgi:type VII secretion integral membrane protein EccD